MKKIFTLTMLLFSISVSVSAQEKKQEYEPAPYWFVGVQGGIQDTFNKEFNNWKTITPTAAISFGRFFSPVVGARLNLNGAFNKGAACSVFPNQPTAYYNYNYLTPSADVLVNLVTLFGKKDYYPLSVNFIGGLGLYHAWNNDEAAELGSPYRLSDTEVGSRNAFNGRVGLQVEYNIIRNLAINIESTFNMHAGQQKTFAKENDQLLVLAGLTYKFGYKKKPVEEEKWETRVDTVWYDDVTYTPRIEDGTITWNVFYKIRESDFNDPDAQLKAIGNFLKDHRECKVTIKSYADVQTGNPKINMGYSQQRSEKAVKALVEAGVDSSIITAEYFGDTVQPFAENDKNRVSIITATGLKDVKDRNAVKKFRTKETRVRVN